MTKEKYICRMCKKSLEHMPDAILVRIVLTPKLREKMNEEHCYRNTNFETCPCFTGEPVIYHLDTKEVHFLESYKHNGSWCSAVLLNSLKPVKREDYVKMVAYLL